MDDGRHPTWLWQAEAARHPGQKYRQLLALELSHTRQAGNVRTPGAIGKIGRPPGNRCIKHPGVDREAFSIPVNDLFWFYSALDSDALGKGNNIPFGRPDGRVGPIEKAQSSPRQ